MSHVQKSEVISYSTHRIVRIDSCSKTTVFGRETVSNFGRNVLNSLCEATPKLGTERYLEASEGVLVLFPVLEEIGLAKLVWLLHQVSVHHIFL